MCCTFRGQSHVHLGTQKVAETKVKHGKMWRRQTSQEKETKNKVDVIVKKIDIEILTKKC